jgi:hypothetical protein
MAAPLAHKAAPPPRKDAARRKEKPRMPEGSGIHIQINFGGETEERGRKVLDLAEDRRVVPRRSRPPPAPDEEEKDTPTYAPAPDEPRAIHAEKLRAVTAKKDVENDDLPTLQPYVKKKTPAPEKKILSDHGEIARATNSFAPPPLPSSVIEERQATEVRMGRVVPIMVAKGWKPPAKRKKPDIHKDGSSLTLEKAFNEAIVSMSRPGSR